MQNKVQIIALVALASGTALWSRDYASIARIINLSPYRVTIEGTDNHLGEVVLKDGTKLTGPQREVNVNDIASINYTVPRGGWDGDLTIRVKDKTTKALIRATNIREYSDTVYYSSGLQRPTEEESGSTSESENITVLIDQNGLIKIRPQLIQINAGKVLETLIIGSPNCGIQPNEIDNLKKIKPGQEAVFLIYPPRAGNEPCKFIAQKPNSGLKAAYCYDFKNHTARLCPCPNDITGKSACNNAGFLWIEGPTKDLGDGIEGRYYGLVRPLHYKNIVQNIFEGIKEEDIETSDSAWFTGSKALAPAQDFGEARKRFDTYNNIKDNNEKFEAEFCEYVCNNPRGKQMVKHYLGEPQDNNEKRSFELLDKTKTMCKGWKPCDPTKQAKPCCNLTPNPIIKTYCRYKDLMGPQIGLEDTMNKAQKKAQETGNWKEVEWLYKQYCGYPQGGVNVPVWLEGRIDQKGLVHDSQ